jgi:hypothetical protein
MLNYLKRLKITWTLYKCPFESLKLIISNVQLQLFIKGIKMNALSNAIDVKNIW